MAGILGVETGVTGISRGLSGHVSKSEKSFSSPAYTRKNHELVVAMLIKTGCNNIVLQYCSRMLTILFSIVASHSR
jgi:hypothetical protein